VATLGYLVEGKTSKGQEPHERGKFEKQLTRSFREKTIRRVIKPCRWNVDRCGILSDSGPVVLISAVGAGNPGEELIGCD
jgi:hypothetical protein